MYYRNLRNIVQHFLNKQVRDYHVNFNERKYNVIFAFIDVLNFYYIFSFQYLGKKIFF